jgi:SAM-dependent methyltransferase
MLNKLEAYSVEQGANFAWGSLTGALSLERLEFLKKHPIKGSLLDAGCAGGAYAKYFSERGTLVTGVDNHGCFLEHASKHLSPTCNFACADLQRLPFPDKSFDYSLCLDVLEHVNDDRIALTELIRVTREKVFIAVPQEDSMLSDYGLTLAPYRDSTHLHYYTLGSLEALFRSVNIIDFTIYPEGRVNFEGLFSKTISSQGKPLRSFHDYHRLKSGGAIARKLTSLALAVLLDLEKIDFDARHYLVKSAVFTDIYQGFFATLNLAE